MGQEVVFATRKVVIRPCEVVFVSEKAVNELEKYFFTGKKAVHAPADSFSRREKHFSASETGF